MAHRRLGSQRWRRLLQPAITLAGKGFEVPYGLEQSLRSAEQRLGMYPESKRIFLRGGRRWNAGDRMIQKDLGRTLSRIAKSGAKDFYEGQTARIIAKEMAAHRGLITENDLREYKAVERSPLTGTYRGYDIVTAPPPSSGGIGILQMLGVLEHSDYEKAGWGSAAQIHYVAETMRRYYADRSEYLGDPDFIRVPVKALLHPRYIERLRASIRPDRASTSDEIRPGNLTAFESSETTHFSILDETGNAVSMTYTLNGGYGSGVTVPGTGILLNNEMDDFAARPGTPNMFGLVQGEANAIQPQKRPLSSMTPTILTRGGKLFMVVGGPGGGRIITSVLQTITNVIDFGMNIRDAVDAPRFHHQWQPDLISVEAGFSPDTVRLLEMRGHKVEGTASVARIFAIVVEPGGWLAGAADGRSYGKAAGY
jgi:gamma-glutamyltranspeptidase/glutathione hydrolase